MNFNLEIIGISASLQYISYAVKIKLTYAPHRCLDVCLVCCIRLHMCSHTWAFDWFTSARLATTNEQLSARGPATITRAFYMFLSVLIRVNRSSSSKVLAKPRWCANDEWLISPSNRRYTRLCSRLEDTPAFISPEIFSHLICCCCNGR